MITQNSEVFNPPTVISFFIIHVYGRRSLWGGGGGGGGGGVVYFTVLCDHPYFVSLLFAVLVSLHTVTFLNVFDYLSVYP